MASSPPPARSLDFGRAFTFVTEDPDWIKKVLIGGGFALLGVFIVGLFFVAGYWTRLLKRVAAGEPRPLPEWDDLGGIFTDGVKIVGLSFLYYCGLLLVVGGLGRVGALGVGGLSAISRRSEDVVGVLGGLGFAGIYALFVLTSLVLMLYLPAAFVRVVFRDDFAEGFAFRANFEFIRANLGNYALSLVFYWVASFLSQFGVLLCCIGLFPAAFWAYCVLAHCLGETVRLRPGAV